MGPSNPEQAPPELHPHPADKPGPPSIGGRSRRRRSIIAWLVVVACNLPIPVHFAFQVTDSGARVGMVLAVSVIAALGAACCAIDWQLGWIVTVGGVVVALSQVLPMLQFFTGLIALGIAAQLGLTASGAGIERAAGVLGGSLVTMITAGILIGVAAVVGLVLQFITPSRWWGFGILLDPDSGTKPDPDPDLDLDLIG
jgi:hypothetical protein